MGMAQVSLLREDVELDAPVLVEGLPGVGLVGKIAADHLVESYDMPAMATIDCEGIPEVAVYREGERAVEHPVRIHVDAERDLLVLQSDVPISPRAADEFAAHVTEWIVDRDATPIYLSGRPAEKDGVPALSGIATGDGEGLLEDADVDPPDDDGAVSGPTGALLHEADRAGLGAVGLIVEADAQFPDPESARILLRDGIAPIAGIGIDTDRLVEQAEEISRAKERLAQQMQQADEASTRAGPLGMYQ